MKESDAKKTYSRFGLTYSIGQLFYTFLVLILTFILRSINPGFVSSMETNILLTYAVLVLLVYPAMYLAIRNLKKTGIPRKKMGIGMLLACFPMAYALGGVANLAGSIVNGFLGRATGNGAVNPVLDLMTGISPAVMVLVSVVLAPVCEELTFRKFLVDRTVGFGESTAVLMSGLIFGLYHGNLSQFVYAFVLGIFFAYIYVRTGKIIYTILMHMFINGFSTMLFQLLSRGLDVGKITGYINSGDMEAYLNYCMEHAGAIAAAGLVGLMAISFLLFGIILVLINAKKVVFFPVPGELERNKIFKSVILNPGMLVFIIYCVANIVIVQLGVDRNIARLIAHLFT